MRNSFLVVTVAAALLCGVGMAQAQPQALYGIDVGQNALIRIDPDTGAGTLVGPLGFDIRTVGVDFACDGTLWGFSRTSRTPSRHSLYTVDLTTGQATIKRVFVTDGMDGGVGFEFGADEDTLYWRNGLTVNQLNPDTGAISLVTTLTDFSYSFTVSPDCSGEFLSTTDGGMLTRFDLYGAHAVIGPIGLPHPPDGPRMPSIASTSDGRVFAHCAGDLYELDWQGTGAASLVGPIGFNITGLAAGPDEVTCSECERGCLPTLDFELDGEGFELVAGEDVTYRFANLGITITTDPQFNPPTIFDSTWPSCDDEDLGTPNEQFGGEGKGWGGEGGRTGRNVLPRGNVLILDEDDDCTPDDKAGGGKLIFTFDEPVPLVTEVHILDVEAGEGHSAISSGPAFAGTIDDSTECHECDARVVAYDVAGQELASRPILGLGDNSFQVVPIGAREVARLEVTLCGSGAVSAVVFCGKCGANFERVTPDE